jgi:hypothetical protein
MLRLPESGAGQKNLDEHRETVGVLSAVHGRPPIDKTMGLHFPDKSNTANAEPMRRDKICRYGKFIILSERSLLKTKRRWPSG